MKYPVHFFVIISICFLSIFNGNYSCLGRLNAVKGNITALPGAENTTCLKNWEDTGIGNPEFRLQNHTDTADMLCRKWIVSKEISGSDTGEKADTFFNVQKKPWEIVMLMKSGSFSIYTPMDISDTSLASMNKELGIWDVQNSFLGELVSEYNGQIINDTMSYPTNSELVIRQCRITCQHK